MRAFIHRRARVLPDDEMQILCFDPRLRPQNSFRVYNFFLQKQQAKKRLRLNFCYKLLKRRSRCVNRTCASKDDDNSSSIHSSALAVLFELVSEASFPGERIFDGSIFGFRFAYGVG